MQPTRHPQCEPILSIKASAASAAFALEYSAQFRPNACAPLKKDSAVRHAQAVRAQTHALHPGCLFAASSSEAASHFAQLIEFRLVYGKAVASSQGSRNKPKKIKSRTPCFPPSDVSSMFMRAVYPGGPHSSLPSGSEQPWVRSWCSFPNEMIFDAIVFVAQRVADAANAFQWLVSSTAVRLRRRVSWLPPKYICRQRSTASRTISFAKNPGSPAAHIARGPFGIFNERYGKPREHPQKASTRSLSILPATGACGQVGDDIDRPSEGCFEPSQSSSSRPA